MPAIIVRNLEGWNYGLGCRERDVKEKLKRLRDEGRNIECIGDAAPGKAAPKSNWSWTRQQEREIGTRLGDMGVPE